MLPFASVLFGGTRSPLIQEFAATTGVTVNATKPTGATTVVIECYGAAGGHGTTDDGSNYTAWWAAGGGGYSKRTVVAQDLRVYSPRNGWGAASVKNANGTQTLCSAWSGEDQGGGFGVGGPAAYGVGDIKFSGADGLLDGGGAAGPNGNASGRNSGQPGSAGRGGLSSSDPSARNGTDWGGGCAVYWDVNTGPNFGAIGEGHVTLTWIF